MDTNEQYQAFCDACAELRDSKIILADSKVSKLLRTVVSCPSLVEIVGDAMVGYNFTAELSKYSSTDLEGNQKIELPAEPYRVIAFVFSLLTEFDTRHLDLQEFVHQYFHADSLTDSFDRFNNELITPFKDSLCEWVGFKKKKVEESPAGETETVCNCDGGEEQQDKQDVDNLFEDLVMILNQIKETVNLDSKVKPDRLDELNITIDALLMTVEMKNLKIMNALLISLNNLLAPIKSVRFYNMELQNRLAEFYENYL